MACAAKPAHVPVDRHVVGRVGEDEVGLPAINGEPQDRCVLRIAAG